MEISIRVPGKDNGHPSHRLPAGRGIGIVIIAKVKAGPKARTGPAIEPLTWSLGLATVPSFFKDDAKLPAR